MPPLAAPARTPLAAPAVPAAVVAAPAAPADLPEPRPAITSVACDVDAPPQLIFNDPQTVCDRAAGAFLGGALGDALGLQVEGDDAITISERHPQGLVYPYKGAFRGYASGDWTDATDTAVLVARSMGAYFDGKVDEPVVDFARRLVRWHKGGFPELGDVAGIGPEGVVLRAMAQPGFTEAPAEAARAVIGPKADNGALLRTTACAFTAAPAEWALVFGEATHADPRALAATCTYALLLNQLAQLPAGADVPATIIVQPVAAGRDRLKEPGRKDDFMARLTATKTLAALELDSRDQRSYAVRTLACAVWALRRLIRTPAAQRDAAFFKATVGEAAAAGGDASANAAVVGTVLGAALGAEQLPADWLAALPNHQWLRAEVSTFLASAATTWERIAD
jgi:ADP-ribosylglycohydrolase